MKNFINKAMTILFTLALIASMVTTSCYTAFAYDNEVDLVAPIWEDEMEEIDPSRH